MFSLLLFGANHDSGLKTFGLAYRPMDAAINQSTCKSNPPGCAPLNMPPPLMCHPPPLNMPPVPPPHWCGRCRSSAWWWRGSEVDLPWPFGPSLVFFFACGEFRTALKAYLIKCLQKNFHLGAGGHHRRWGKQLRILWNQSVKGGLRSPDQVVSCTWIQDQTEVLEVTRIRSKCRIPATASALWMRGWSAQSVVISVTKAQINTWGSNSNSLKYKSTC